MTTEEKKFAGRGRKTYNNFSNVFCILLKNNQTEGTVRTRLLKHVHNKVGGGKRMTRRGELTCFNQSKKEITAP